MAEDFDIEAMLEAPYKKHDEINNHNDRARENGTSNHESSKSSGKSRHRSRSRSKDRRTKSRERDRRSRSKDRRSRSKERRSSRDRIRSHSKDKRRGSRERDRDRRSRSKDKRRGSRDRDTRRRSKDRDSRRRSRDRNAPVFPPNRDRRRSRSRDRRDRTARRSPSPIRAWQPSRGGGGRSPPPRRGPPPPPEDDISPEERDARTIFCMQLSQRIRARDLEEFFSAVGKVRDVRLITCNKTRRFKGIAYIEFKDPESVPLALGLSGQKLLGIPIVVQNTQAEKNRMGNSMPNLMPKGMTGPMRLYVGSLHFNITEDMLRGIFEPFGKIDNIQLIMDPETGRSKGYGFITFNNCEDAKKALEQLNGFELAGRPMKVGNVTERLDLQQTQAPSILDSDELDRSGIDLGATGRLQLMFKLAEGAGLQVPAAAASALSMTTGAGAPVASAAAPPIATQCFMLSNMFDPVEAAATDPNWHVEIRDDVIEECNKHGGVLHVYVDRASPQGNVYVKCPSIATAVASVNSLHGRWFAGRVITAAYVPLLNYHSLFPDAMTALTLLLPTRKPA